jgi:HSP20 family protein
MAELYGEFPDRLRGNSWQPAVDIFETGDAVVARVELPGVNGGDIRVNVDEDFLLISGMRRLPPGADEGRLHQMEISFGPFQRRVRISIPFERDGVSAHLEDGFLSVSLPKVKPKRHSVKVDTE